MLRKFRELFELIHDRFTAKRYRLLFSERRDTAIEMLVSVFGIINPTEREICASMVLAYNQLGGSKTKDAHPEILEELGDEGLFIFKGIFGNNNKQKHREIFFGDAFIRKIWATLMRLSEEDFFFNRPIP